MTSAAKRYVSRASGDLLQAAAKGAAWHSTPALSPTTARRDARRTTSPRADAVASPSRHASSLCSLLKGESVTTSDKPEHADVVVVGGGVVGLALACALGSSATFRSSKASIALIEASSLARLRSWAEDKQRQAPVTDWENRVIYLTEDNRAWLDAIGAWKHLVQSRLCPVQGMHVTDGLTNAALDFDIEMQSRSSGSNEASPESRRRLGTMVEISNLQQAMLRRISEINERQAAAAQIRILEESAVESIEPAEEPVSRSTYQDARPVLHFETSRKPLKARLLVGADGANSPVRKYAGIQAQGWGYGRFGVVTTMQYAARPTGEEGERIAYQRFLPTGTIAWLPLADNAASLVWTLPPDVAKAIVAMQKGIEGDGRGEGSPLSQLITAAFRLPWASLRPILDQLATCDPTKSMAWLGPLINERMVEASMELMDEGNVPSPVTAIRAKSTAAFPLKLAHAESYLGSSMRRTTIAEAGAGAFVPSAVLSGIARTFSALTSPPETVVDQAGPQVYRGRTALIGDAAHTIHPLAGQGLNLGLADARSLSNVLERAVEQGADLGSHVALKAYPRDRYLANQVMLSAVDHLHWLFVSPRPPGTASQSFAERVMSRAAIWARSTGFEVLNELGPVKQAIMGAAGSAQTRRRTKGDAI